MPTPKVSVVIASFNHGQYISACLQSVLEQSFEDFEILVTDDGSVDATQDVLAKILDPRVKTEFFPKNLGACIALNNCIRRSSGKYIAVLNSDDLFLPGKLQLQVDYLDANPQTAAVFGKPAFINEQGACFLDAKHKDYSAFQVNNQSNSAWLRHFFDKGNCLCHPTIMIRRTIYENIGLYDTRLAQVPDLDMWIRLCSRHEIYLIDSPVTAFRIRDNLQNASSGRPEVIIRDAWERKKILEHYQLLDIEIFSKIFPEYDANQMARDWWLGIYAIQLNTPFHTAFGLDCLFSALQSCNWDSHLHGEFVRLTGSHDLYGLRRETVSTEEITPDISTLSNSMPVDNKTAAGTLNRIAKFLRNH